MAAYRHPGDHRNPRVPEQPFGDVLVHADGGAGHIGTHIRDHRQLQKPLHGAVLSVGAMKHGKDHIDCHPLTTILQIAKIKPAITFKVINQPGACFLQFENFTEILM